MTDVNLLKLMQNHTSLPNYWNHEEYVLWKASVLQSCQEKTVLDVGCQEGYFSFLMEQKGAKSVYSLDYEKSWKPCFENVKKILNSNCEFQQSDLYDVQGTFDVTLCLDVYYHIDDPIRLLRFLRKKTNETLYFGGIFKSDKQPIMYLFDDCEFDGDPTNTWSASISCIERMMKKVGFKVITTNFAPHQWERFMMTCE